MKKTLGKNESSSDVVNSEPKVLLIGYGWVGQYMGKFFKEADYVTSDGIIRSRKYYDEVICDTKNASLCQLPHYDMAIIGVPTPMNPETGQCDVSIVEKAVEKYRNIVDIFLVKSTVEVGTCQRLETKYEIPVCMSPEYVGETLGHPLLEAKRDTFQIIGGNDVAREIVAGYFMKVLHANAPIHLCTSKEAEIIKYCENMWIMRRVDLWNDIYDITDKLGASFQSVREGLVLDPRLNRTHSFVYEDNRGWSGKCLPKDMNALAHTMRKAGRPLPVLEHQIEKNVAKWRKGYKNVEKLIPDKPLWQESIKMTGFEDRPFSGNRGH
jgi:UDPglucose 6-dehydrogenase